jgi:hypothetical protein
MSFWDRLLRREAADAPEEDDGKGYPKKSFVTGKQLVFFDSDNDDKFKFRRMYEQGGLVGEAIDAYGLFAFTNGYRLEGDDEPLKEAVQEFLDKVDIETLGRQMITDALVVDKGFAEKVGNRIGTATVGLMYRPGETFKEVLDERGNVIKYIQTVMRDRAAISVELEPGAMFVLDLHTNLIRRAYKDILIDAAIADATATSIQRHGYPRYHVKLGLPGEAVSEDALRDHGRQFENIKANMEWTTTQDVTIDNIDKEGVSQAKLYSDWAIMRAAAALGVPEEMLGLGRGSTEATASVRMDAFRDKIGAIQKSFARSFTTQVIDALTGKPGAVWFEFNDVSPVDDQAKADFIAKIVSATPVDNWAIITPTWAREYLGIELSDDDPDNPEGETAKERPPPAPNPFTAPPTEEPEVIKE